MSRNSQRTADRDRSCLLRVYNGSKPGTIKKTKVIEPPITLQKAITSWLAAIAKRQTGASDHRTSSPAAAAIRAANRTNRDHAHPVWTKTRRAWQVDAVVRLGGPHAITTPDAQTLRGWS